MRPVGVLLQGPQQPVAVAPEHVEAEPGRVVRRMGQQPLCAGHDRVGVAGDRPRPLRRALVHGHRLHAVGDLGQQLHHGGAGANHRDALAVDRQALGPLRRMEAHAGEVGRAFDARDLRVAQLPDGADEEARAQLRLAIGPLQARHPLARVVVPAGAHQPRREADVPAQADGLDHLQQVGHDVFAAREVARPQEARPERQRVGVVRRVHAAARIAVHVPGAADLGRLLDDGEGHAELGQAGAQRDAADPRADDQHVVVASRRTTLALGPAHAARHQGHLLAREPRVFVRHAFAQAQGHHALHQFVARVVDRRRLAAPQHLDRGVADALLCLGRQAGRRIRNEVHVAPRAKRPLEPRQIAGHVDQHHEQHAQVGGLHGLFDLAGVEVGLCHREILCMEPGASPATAEVR